MDTNIVNHLSNDLKQSYFQITFNLGKINVKSLKNPQESDKVSQKSRSKHLHFFASPNLTLVTIVYPVFPALF